MCFVVFLALLLKSVLLKNFCRTRFFYLFGPFETFSCFLEKVTQHYFFLWVSSSHGVRVVERERGRERSRASERARAREGAAFFFVSLLGAHLTRA